MAIPKTITRAIILKERGVRKELIAGGTITPGHLIAINSAGKFVVHPTAGGRALTCFADMQDHNGKGIDDDYVVNDFVMGEIVHAGAEVNALLAANAAAVAVGDYLESAGDGTLKLFAANAGLYDIGTLLVSATAEKFKTTTTAAYRIDGVQYTKAATDNLVFTANDTINTAATAGLFYGIWLVQINAAGTISTKSPSADQVYTSSALALAAKPAPDAGNVALGWIIVGAKTGASWTANTDDMTATDSASRTFTDASTETSDPAYSVAQALEAVNNSAGATPARIQVIVL